MASNRFVDDTYSGFQAVNHSPIFGYEHASVRTLEEAVGKIDPPIAHARNYVVTAINKCKRHSSLLTRDESAAIYLYSMPIPFFSTLNNTLRAENRQALKSWFPFLKLFITALKKLPSTKAIVWRGVNYDDTLTFVDDDVHVWWAINSCSKALNIVQPFLGNEGTLFAIEAANAKDISGFSAVPDEHEVVLMPGTRVRRRYESLSLINRFFVLHLEEMNPQKEPQTKSNCLYDKIRQIYQRNNRIHRIINPAKSFPIQHSYINLSIVKSKEQQEKEKQLHDRQHGNDIIGGFEEIYGMKTMIDLKDIFQTCQNTDKQVLVFGRAGIGKSTFCRYVAYQWATGKLWSQYELLVLIPLRRLTSNRYSSDKSYSLIDLIKKEVLLYDLSEQDDAFLKEAFDRNKTLWILDGYDEIVNNVPPHLEYLFEQLLDTSHHIITSRPYMNTLSYDVQMEITGFTDENIQQYIQLFFYQMKDELKDAAIRSQRALDFLRRNRNIWGVAHIPINLELICSVWSNEDISDTKELSMTSLYTIIIEWICRRYLTPLHSQILQLSRKEIYQRCDKELKFLETLAYHAMKENTITIRPSVLENALNEVEVLLEEHPHILNMGILKSFSKQGIDTQIQINKDYYFVHLSFQEFFAARYLTNALNGARLQEAIDFIQYQKYNQRYTLVFIFAVGLLAENNDKRCMNLFWNALLAESLDLVGIRHMQLVIYCLEETSNKARFPRATQLLGCLVQCIRHILITRNEIVHQYISQALQRAQSVATDQTIVNTLITLLTNEHTYTKAEVLLFITAVNFSDAPPPLITSIISMIDDKNILVRQCAYKALLNLCEKVVNDDVISKLVTALGDEDHHVRWSARAALGKMGEKATSNQVINKLLPALGDNKGRVTESACEVLAKMGEKVATIEVITKLVSILEHESYYIRRSACEALGKMGEKAARNEVISTLVTAVRDESYYVRRSACEALAKMGEKAATNEVINKLVTALEDEDCHVRRSAREALVNMGEKVATYKLISKLITILGHESYYVRRSACEAFGKMGEKAATNEVISKLVAGLEDDTYYVRQSACEVLGNMGEKAATNEVISKLVSILEHESYYVRRSACEALGKMGQKAATNEVINKLVTALEDEDYGVRRSACEALGNMDEKVATNEVISKLVTALEDENYNVKHSACEVLGKMGEKTATNEVISKLIAILGHESYYVRRSACEALGKMGQKAATNEVINKLVTALEDEDYGVRGSACKALGNMGEKAATNEVISKLVTILEHENHYVRQSACEALGKMGVKAATNEVISKLVTALGHKNYDFRGSACEALGKLGKKAATNEVISKLVTALEDENYNVKQSACEALGRMGEKAATDDVISALTVQLYSSDYLVSYRAINALESILSSCSAITRLNPEQVSFLCLSEYGPRILQNISADQLIEFVLNTENRSWFSVVTQFTLRIGAAVTFTGNNMIVYDKRGPTEFPVCNVELGNQLVEAFKEEAKRLHLFF